jgi:hypothetical protein
MTLAMYFEIEGSNVRVGGTMHRVPQGQPLAHWVHDAIGWASLIYLEHAKDDSYLGRYAPPSSRPLVHRLPRSWPRVERKCQFDLVRRHHLSRLKPFAVLWDILDPVPSDEGAEHLALARSKENRPSGPRINYLETNEQAYALADDVSDAVWDEAVNWALDNPGSSKKVLELSYRAWVAGDFEEIDRINSHYTRNRFSEIRHAVIAARNCLWIPTIRELVQSANAPTLVLVGAAHFGGPDGLVSQLAAGGLRLTKC